MARRASKMPWHAKPFFGGGRSPGWHVPPDSTPVAFTFVDQTGVVAALSSLRRRLRSLVLILLRRFR
jgi:hypothetical protein